MINALIFSKNRPARLHLCIESILENCNIFDKIFVVYKYNDAYEESYKLLFDRFKQEKKIIFREEILPLIEEFYYFINNLETPYVCFITDDTVFYKKNPETKDNILSVFDGKTISFSLRLGKNTIVQDYRDNRHQPELYNEYEISNNIIKWNYNKYNKLDNYGYPFGMDGCIFESEEIQKLLDCIVIKNLRDFEGQLSLDKRYLYEKRKPFLASMKESLCVNIPTESVLGGLHHSNKVNSPEEELDRYKKGYIYINSISGVIGCHQEILLNWKKYNG